MKDFLKNEMILWKKNRGLTILTLPAVIVLIVMCYLPMFGIIIAFKDYNYSLGILNSPWNGFKNFEFFFKSSDAWRITRNTLLYNSAYLIAGTSISVLFAICMNELSKRWIKVYQTVMFIPYFISWIVVGYLMTSFLDTQYGLMNRIISTLGGNTIGWYNTKAYWPFILIFMNIWKYVGYNTVIYYATIIGIDPSYYEAAKLDGAGGIQMIKYITLPMLKKIIIILFILSLGNIFRGDFGLHYFGTNNAGALYSVTDVIDTYAFRALRQMGDIPMASAVSAFQSTVGCITILIANRIIKKIDADAALL
ncbi:ABC transporter permease [Lachnoclostridium phytofermentans]|uniref:Binding-protein-dependent transport systems inner membrane component n=1 Tax=Lachnoclostridium phytofermentans (strain ATCC 700394 / DSM 18823 / ISDg) TaxID=357809 RepID=A9KRK7_LACP7|nr:ABC transporter permease subunit [Lachnoclostridium phytofermentans]ABX42081.1 binding-protein-dependent transport systems inner membrane component [Lachnoclostridium phytofermentans ISDg]